MADERCARCGTPRKDDIQVCVSCETPFPGAAEDLDLTIPRPAAPSPTQSHGTVMVALLAGFVGLAIFFGLSVRGVGPFTVEVRETVPAGDVVRLTIEVRNDGSKAGRGNCRVGRVSAAGDQRPEHRFQSDRVPARSSVTQTIEVPVEPGVRPAQVTC